MDKCAFITTQGKKCGYKRGKDSEYCTFHLNRFEKMYCRYITPGTSERCFNSKYEDGYCYEHHKLSMQRIDDPGSQCVIVGCERPATFNVICGIHYNTLCDSQLAQLNGGLYLTIDKDKYVIIGHKDVGGSNIKCEVQFKGDFKDFYIIYHLARTYIETYVVVGTAEPPPPPVVAPVVLQTNNNAVIDVDEPDPECQCCYEELRARDVIRCGGGHEFCKECVEKQLTVKISEGMPSSKCWECGEELDLLTIDPTIVNKIDEITAHKNIAQFATICDDFQICPFCSSWGCIVVEDDNNPWIPCEGCKKTWCKKCRGEGHNGSCNIIRDPTPEKIRNRIVAIMDEAFMRKCPHCNIPYIKEVGCNLMKCDMCKGSMCFICNQKITPKTINGKTSTYYHFKGTINSEPGAKCQLYNDENGETNDQGNEAHLNLNIRRKCLKLVEVNDEPTGKMIKKILKKEYKIVL